MRVGLPIIEARSEQSSDVLVFNSCHFEMLIVAIIENAVVESAELQLDGIFSLLCALFIFRDVHASYCTFLLS